MCRFLLYILLCACVFVSCSKNKDKNPPHIVIAEPLNNVTIQAGNYVRVKGEVHEDKNLEYVTIKVLSIDGNTQIADTYTVPITGNDVAFDRNILVGDIHTATGNYQVVVEAFDGKNSEKEYRDIKVNEIPRVFKKLIIVRKSAGGYAADSLAGSGFVNFFNRSTDFSSASISNYHQQVYLAGFKQGVLEALSLEDHTSISWTIPADIPASSVPLFYFNEYSTGELLLWQSMAGTVNGRLKAFGYTGSVMKNIAMSPNYYASAMLTTSSHYIVAEAPVITSSNPMLTYFFKTGLGLDQTTVMPLSAKRIFELSSTELVVIGNSSGQGELRIYDYSTNGFWEQVNVPIGKVYDAVQLDANTYIIAHETGLLKFTHSPTNLINLTIGNKAQLLCLDDFSGILYAAEGNFVRIYDPSSGVSGGSFVAVDSVKAILPHYNK